MLSQPGQMSVLSNVHWASYVAIPVTYCMQRWHRVTSSACDCVVMLSQMNGFDRLGDDLLSKLFEGLPWLYRCGCRIQTAVVGCTGRFEAGCLDENYLHACNAMQGTACPCVPPLARSLHRLSCCSCVAENVRDY